MTCDTMNDLIVEIFTATKNMRGTYELFISGERLIKSGKSDAKLAKLSENSTMGGINFTCILKNKARYDNCIPPRQINVSISQSQGFKPSIFGGRGDHNSVSF